MFVNPAVYAANRYRENRTASRAIELDEYGNVVNPTNHWGNPWHEATIEYARERRAFDVYVDAMDVLDSVIGEDRDVSTRNGYSQAMGKFKSVEHATEMIERLQIAALNGSNAALIAFAAASIYVNKYAFVDFEWYVDGEAVQDVVNDYEGFAATIRISADVPAPTTMQAAPECRAPTTTITALRPALASVMPTVPHVTISPISVSAPSVATPEPSQMKRGVSLRLLPLGGRLRASQAPAPPTRLRLTGSGVRVLGTHFTASVGTARLCARFACVTGLPPGGSRTQQEKNHERIETDRDHDQPFDQTPCHPHGAKER